MSTGTKAVHTAGPWELEVQQSWPFGVRVFSGPCDILSQHPVAFSSDSKSRKDIEQAQGFPINQRPSVVKAIAEQTANAHLIAAAPDMLEALRTISDRDPCNQTDGIVGDCLLNPPCIGCIARAAIRKAEGEL